MPLVVTSVPNLAQGVSQQPDNLRYPGQCDEQINAWATVVEGLVKRPNTRWINEFNSGSTPTNLFTHFVKRDEQNKYCVTVSLGSSVPTVGVIDLASGTNISVATTSIANSYLSGITNPLSDLRALTVADYTFLVNKKKTVAKNANSYSDPPDKEALVVVKLGDYEKGYSVYINDTLVPLASSIASNPHSFTHHNHQTATYISGGSGSTGGGKYADTEFIAKDLATCIAEAYASSRTGVTSVTFTNGGSGYLENLKFLRRGDVNSLLFYRDIYDAGSFPKRVAFEVVQNSPSPSNPGTTFRNTSAKGFCEVLNGTITNFVLTNNGSNYDASIATSVVLRQEVYNEGAWRYGNYNTITTATGMTAHISTIDPFIVERQGSVIRIRKTINVSNGGGNYLLLKEHKSNSDSEPGVGSDWEHFWEETTSTAGASAWSIDRVYEKGTDFDLRVTDGLANEGLEAVYKEIASITDLPKQCFNNFIVKVKGDADIDQDDYYVKFTTDNKSEFGKGTWVETIGWTSNESDSGIYSGVQTQIDATTMPVTLVPVFTGDDITSFKLQTPEEDQTATAPNEIGWRTRQAGDDNTNPFPSFVGGTINDVFFFKNRLGFLTDSNVIFSEADEYFNFFRTTTQQLLDSAPIDVGLSHTKVAVLQHALPFQEKLMLFSDNSQFVLRGADVLSPKTVAISPVTEYDISDGINPLVLGPYIYFPFKRGQFEGMFEYFVDNNTEVFEAEEITSQIPKYIPSSIKQMSGSASESMVLLQNATDAKTLFVYKYFWSGKEKIQSAWQKWTFDDDVTGFDFIDSTLYLILNGKVLVEMPVENAITDVGLDYTLLLDNRVDGAGKTVSYNEQTNRTTISGLPTGYGATVDNMTVFTKGGSERNVVASASGTSVEIEGFIASYVKYNDVIYKCVDTHTSSSSDTPGVSAKWTVSTDLPNAPTWSDDGILYNDENYFVVGKPYNMLYRFSNQALKQPTERGGRSASDYTYQTIRNASIEYADSGHFTVEVTSRFRDTYSYVYNPAVLSSISTLDRFTPESGHFRFGVQCRPDEATIEVKSSSALPVKLLAAEFESMVTGRSKRYGA